MTDILYILSHKPDNRYMKRFELFKPLYSQAVLFWDKANDSVPMGLPIDASSIHIPADQSNPTKRIPQTIEFSKRATNRLLTYQPRCLYVGNLDMLRIAVEYKMKHTNVRIVYEIADLHRLIVDRQKGLKHLLQIVLTGLEKKYIQYIDLLVVTSEKFYDVYYKNLVPRSKMTYMPNLPAADVFDGYVPCGRQPEFTVGYFGWVRYLDQLNGLLDVSQKIGCKVIIAGADNSGDEFRERCVSLDNVEYIGPFDYSREIVSLYNRVDCVYSVYDADMFNVRVALPNKLYEAIIARKPIIVAKNTFLSELVQSMGVGVSVRHNDALDIEHGIRELMVPVNYDACANACTTNHEIALPDKYNEVFLTSMKRILF